MKRKTLIVIAFLLILAGIFYSCGKDEVILPNNPNEEENNPIENSSFLSDSVYYIVGYNACSGVREHDDGTSKSGGYLFVSENLKDTLFTSNLDSNGIVGNLLDDIFTFPVEIIRYNVAGYNFFPQEYRFMYKVQITCRPMTKEEERLYVDPPCHPLYPVLYWVRPKCVVITSIFKIQ